MRLKLLFFSVAIIAISCKENKSTIKEPIKDNKEISKELSKEDYMSEFKKLNMALEKALTTNDSNRDKAKMISTYMNKSILNENDKKKILKKVMHKMELSLEDQKEITFALSVNRK